MKELLLLVAVCAASAASAQTTERSFPKTLPFDQKALMRKLDGLANLKTNPSTVPNVRTVILQQGRETRILPQDNMPCIAPDLAQMGNMPVLGKNLLRLPIDAEIYAPYNQPWPPIAAPVQ